MLRLPLELEVVRGSDLFSGISGYIYKVKRVSVENKCVDSGHPTAGMLLGLVLRKPIWYLWGTSRTCSAVHHVPPCRPVVGWVFGWGDVPWSSVLHARFSLLSAVLSTSTLSLRDILSFWNWSFSFQVSSLPPFSVILQHNIEECESLSHLLSLLSYDAFSC